jgi:hypothetical protein
MGGKMIMSNYRSRNVVWLMAIILTLLLSGCSKNIEGNVSDPFGKGIEGVNVQILTTQFKATTDSSGKYSIDFVPGAFTIQFSKNDYTTHKIDLNMPQKSKFAAEPVTLYPIPKNPSIYLLGDSGLLELAPKPVGVEEKSIRWPPPPSNQYRYYMIGDQAESKENQKNANISIKPGKAVFVDKYPKPARLFKLGDGNALQEYTSAWGGRGDRKFIYNGLLEHKERTVGDEMLFLRTVDLEPGNYAWCGMVEVASGGMRPDKDLPCFPFAVAAPQASEKK